MSVTLHQFFHDTRLSADKAKDFATTPKQAKSGLLEPVSFEVKHSVPEKTDYLFRLIHFPYNTLKYLFTLIRRKAGIIAYPITAFEDRPFLNGVRANAAKRLKREGWIFKRLTVKYHGKKYDALLFTHPDIRTNKEWMIRAVGNIGTAEQWVQGQAIKIAEGDKNAMRNSLIVNGPGISSEGDPITEDMRDAQLAGIEFVEKVIKATKIFIHANSLGGGSMSLAINHHKFSKKIRYVVAFDRTFNFMSRAGAGLSGVKIISLLYRHVFKLETNNVAASKKLSEKGVHQIVVQSAKKAVSLDAAHPYILDPIHTEFTSDAFIREGAILAKSLQEEKILKNKTFMGMPYMHHGNDAIPQSFTNAFYEVADNRLNASEKQLL